MSVPVDRKPERAVQAKIWGTQKKRIHARWIENPKGRSRQKLGIQKQKNKKKKQNKKDRGMTISSMPTKILCADLQITASSKILINNGLYPQKVSSSRVLHRERVLPHQWFDQQILPHQWFNNGLYPINGLING